MAQQAAPMNKSTIRANTGGWHEATCVPTT